jgi:diketogulonate reductase-like aldo/keto reductase
LGRGDSYDNPKNDYNIIKDDLINEIANKHGKTPGQVILKSSLFRGVGVIPKTSSLARLQ